jgi:hypothetical protein
MALWGRLEEARPLGAGYKKPFAVNAGEEARSDEIV